MKHFKFQLKLKKKPNIILKKLNEINILYKQKPKSILKELNKKKLIFFLPKKNQKKI